MRFIHTVSCFFALLLPTLVPLPLRAQEEGLNWLGDYQEARRIARQTNKPLFVEFRCEA